MALMFLLPRSPHKTTKKGVAKGSALVQNVIDENSMESTITSAFQVSEFGENIVKHLALDHNYAEGHSAYQSSSMNDMGLTALMPSVKREWPYTRTWDANSCGEQFHWFYAKLFKSLVRESGSTVLQQLRAPLEEAAGAVEERGKQCIAAEIVAGLVRSGMLDTFLNTDYLFMENILDPCDRYWHQGHYPDIFGEHMKFLWIACLL
jgi:hypothetical protein